MGALAGAGSVHAQQLALDPSTPRQGTTLLVALDKTVLAPGGTAATSLAIALDRRMRLDTGARERLCRRREAARSACPDSSRIGFGRFTLALTGYEPAGGDSEVAWAISAFLGEPSRRGDAASVVLVANLLGADLVDTLLEPKLGMAVPATTVTTGRLVRRRGVALEFAELPARLDLPAPATALPAQLELTLGAVRRVRRDFTRRIRIRTPSGYEVRKVKDHALVGRHLLSTPRSCDGEWSAQLRVGVGHAVRRLARSLSCTT